MKKFACMALCFIMLLGLCPLAKAESSKTAILAAVNTLYSVEDNTEGNFSANEISANFTLNGAQERGIYDIYTDEETGEVYTILEPDLPQITPLPYNCTDAPQKNLLTQSTSYNEGSSFSLTEYDKRTKNSMHCLYVGTYCTVWGSVSDHEDIQLSAQNAKSIANAFDENFAKMTAAFGSYWCDADNDGKIALMCYDIDHQYGKGDPGSYTAGYFWARDMIARDGYINGINFDDANHINGIDCVHIDTYPTMGQSSDLFGRIENSYSTLFHELQHMLNFSYCVKGGADTYYRPMDDYLDEAFAMAAEHYIFGSSATMDRIIHFNGINYTPGTSLTNWDSTLSNYANSYLFGQYLRTRYGQMTGTDGWGFYADIFARRNKENYDTLAIITDLLGTTPEQLILDFWTAVYEKNGTGVHGFAGEEWAKSISPQIYPSVTNANRRGIYPGGAKFYSVSPGYSPTGGNNVSFLTFYDAAPPETTYLKAERTSENTGEIKISISETGKVYYAVAPASAQYASEFYSLDLNADTLHTIPVGSLESYSEYKFFYYLEDNFGNTSETESIKVPAWFYRITAKQSDGGTLTLANGENPLSSGDYAKIGSLITVNALCDEGKELKALYLDGEKLNSNSFTVRSDHTVSARFGKKDIAAASTFASGTGTEADPYMITTIAELKYFAQRINSGDDMAGKYVALGADIELDGFELDAIGADSSTPFRGTFDAKGHYISGLYKFTEAKYSGLFGYLEGTVQNLVLTDSTVTNESAEGHTAFIAAANYGSVQNCVVTGGTLTSTCTQNSSTGAIAGINRGTVSRCYADAEISSYSEGIGRTGGIVGENYGTITDCLANCNISAEHTEATYAGGITGETSGGAVSGCYVANITVKATAPESTNAGGIAGRAGFTNISGCAVNAKAIKCYTGNELYCSIDQLIGSYNNLPLENCFYSAATKLTVNASSADSHSIGNEASASELCSEEFLKAYTDLDFDSVWETGTHPALTCPTLQVMRTLLGEKITVLDCEGGLVSADYDAAYIGQTVTLTATAMEGFTLDHFTLDGEALYTNTFTVTGDHTAGAVFTLDYEDAVDGGVTGEVVWVFTEDNELLFLGEGAMADYESAAERPWHRYAASVSKFTVGEGITHVGKFAAANCTAITGVYIPEGVLSIGDSAFASSAVSEVIIPSTLERVGSIASASLKNLFYMGIEADWAKVNKASGLDGLIRYGLPISVKGANMLDAYPIGGTVATGVFIATMADGSECELGGNAYLKPYAFTQKGEASLTVCFFGAEYEYRVTVYKDRHADVKTEGGKLTVTVYGNDVIQAVAAIYKDGKMVGIKCVTLPKNGTSLTLDYAAGEGITAKIFLLGEGSSPLESNKTVAL